MVCPIPHALASLSAQGLECYHCPDDPPESSCNTTTCPFPDGFCVTQEAEIIVGKFFVAYIERAEGGENIMSGHLLWTMVLLPPSRALLGLEWDSCKVGAVGIQRCAGMWIIKRGYPLACMVFIIPLYCQCSHVMLLPICYV